MRKRDPDELTAREREVLDLLRRDFTNEQIAARLGISLDGAKYHVSQILSKLGVATRDEAAAVALAERRRWWAAWPLWVKIGGAAAVASAAAGLTVLAWGVLRTGDAGENDDLDRLTDLRPNTVTYNSEDGVRIVASWFLPEGQTKPPVVILLHEQDGTRAQWDPLVKPLLDEGYAVLAPDLRGFGESNKIVRDGVEEPYMFGDRLAALGDVAVAIEWLNTQSEVDATRIGIVGSRLGGDLAYVSTAVFGEVIKAAVAITPSRFDPNDPLLGSIPDYAAHDVFVMAGGVPQWEDAVSLGVRLYRPDGYRYEYRSDLDGVALLTIDEPIADMLVWFKEKLLATPAPTASPTAQP
jgi:dienelactone hydrolase/DNA-binding CsgD family transcriptional regulator